MQDVAALKRDTADTNKQVGTNPDLKNLLDKQADTMAAAQAAGAAIARTVGDYATAKQKDAEKQLKIAEGNFNADPSPENQAAIDAARADVAGWKEGGAYRAELHMAGGALVAGLGGGSALAGAAAAGLTSFAAPTLNNLGNAVASGVKTGNDKVDAVLGNLVANAVATGIGAAAGGGSGAAVASTVDAYNRQLHESEKEKIRAQANGDKALEERLTKAACYEVKCWAEYPVGSDLYNKNYVNVMEAGQLKEELAWVHRQQEAKLFVYAPAQKAIDAIKSDPIGLAKDSAKIVTGGLVAKTGATICTTTGLGCLLGGGGMVAFGLSDVGAGADGLYNRFNGINSPGTNVLRYGFDQLSPTWGTTVYDGLNLLFNVGAMRAQVPLKMGVADGLGRPNSMFNVTVSRFNNPTLTPFLKRAEPNGTTQNILLFGAGAKAATVVTDVTKALNQ